MIKTAVHFATTRPLPAHGRVGNVLTASANDALTIDGQLVANGQRILVKNESAAHPEHGVYDVTAAGTPTTRWVLTRSSDWAKPKDFEEGTLVLVLGGSQRNHVLVLETLDPMTLNTTPVRFSLAKTGPADTHDACLYVTPDGNDSNSGRSLDDALLTIRRAIELLPNTGGDIWYLSLPVAATDTQSTRYVRLTANDRNPLHDTGLKILGHVDPNWNNPPPGWIKEKPFRLRPLICSETNHNATSEGVSPLLGGDSSDIRDPALWLSGTTSSIVIQNADFRGPVRLWGPSDMGFGPAYAHGDQLAYFDVALMTPVDIEHCPANIGGATLETGFRVLLANQGNVAVDSRGFTLPNRNRPVGFSCAHPENGPYEATKNDDGTFRLQRVADFSTDAQLEKGCLTWVREGDHAGIWLLASPQNTGTMGTTAQEWWKYRVGMAHEGRIDTTGLCNTLYVSMDNCILTSVYSPALHIGYVYWSRFSRCKMQVTPKVNVNDFSTPEGPRSIVRAAVLIATEVSCQILTLDHCTYVGGGLILRGQEFQAGNWGLSVTNGSGEPGGWGAVDFPPYTRIQKPPSLGYGVFEEFIAADVAEFEDKFSFVIEGNLVKNNIVVRNVGSVKGQCTILGNDGRWPGVEEHNLAAKRQVAHNATTFVASHDGERSVAPGARVLATNLVNQDPSSWLVPAGVTLITGQQDKYGRTNAAKFTAPAGIVGGFSIRSSMQNIKPGGFIVAGIWFAGSASMFPVARVEFETGGNAWKLDEPYNDQSVMNLETQHRGKGWQWLGSFAKIKTVGAPASIIKLTCLTTGSERPHSYCYPVLYYLDPDLWTENDAAEFALHVAPHPHVADVGVSALLPDEDMQFYGGHRESRSPQKPETLVQLAAGSGAKASIAGTGTDDGGQIALVTGDSPSVGDQVHVQMRRAFHTQPIVTLTPANATASANAGHWYVRSIDLRTWAIAAGATPTGIPVWNYRVEGAGRALTTPESIATPFYWHRADTFALANGILTFTNRFGAGPHLTQATAGAQPVHVMASPNMRTQDTFRYDTAQACSGATASDWAFLHRECVLAIAFHGGGGATGRTLCATHRGPASTIGMRVICSTGGLAIFVSNGNADVFGTFFSASLATGPHCAVIALDTTSTGLSRLRCSIDGAPITAATQRTSMVQYSTANPQHPLTIGARLSSSGEIENAFDSEIAEVLVWSGTISDSEIRDFYTDYFQVRYGF